MGSVTAVLETDFLNCFLLHCLCIVKCFSFVYCELIHCYLCKPGAQNMQLYNVLSWHNGKSSAAANCHSTTDATVFVAAFIR